MVLYNKIDWVIKKHLLERYMKKKGWDYKTPQILMMSIKYHDIDPQTGLFNILKKEGQVERIIEDDSVIRKYMDYAPEDTRAYFRSRSLKMYTKYIRSVNWDTIKFDIGDEKMKTIPLLNPLKGTKNMVEALFEKGLSVKDFIEELEG